MCGIAGIVNLDGKRLKEDQLFSAGQIMKYRGPDASGVYISDNVGLAHNRLSILDLSTSANQPMHADDGNLTLVFNGEIYNFRSLRNTLIKLGYNFKTNSDTETILAAYQVFGIQKLLNEIDGMFAFVLFDRVKNQLIVVRDRFGKKPLYYSHQFNKFIFCSDIRFVSENTDNKTINVDSLVYYFQEMAMPQPNTIWNEIKQVNPGYYLVVDILNKSCVEYNYHKFKADRIITDEKEALETTEDLLQKSIVKRLESDVPISCFLSGGVDSGLIVSLYAKLSNKSVNTFSVGYENDDMNELVEAKKLAQKYSTNHQEIIIKPNIKETITQILDEQGEPFADSSIIPSFLITKEMAGKYKVALSGDGGDELFGYPEYAKIYEFEKFMLENANKFKRNIKINSSKLFARISSAKNFGYINDYNDKLKNHGHLLMRDMVFSDRQISTLLNNLNSEFTHDYHKSIWELNNESSITDKLMLGSFKTRLLNDYLVKVDRSSMMNGVEVRSPFLDVNLATFALSIDHELLFKNGPKTILKNLGKKYIDPEIYNRKKKGFGIPIGKWIRVELKDFTFDLLSPSNLKKHNLMNENFVSGLLDEHINKGINHTHKIWSLICFQYWFNKYGQ